MAAAVVAMPDHPDMAMCSYHPNMFTGYGRGSEKPLSDTPANIFYTKTTDPLAVSLDGTSGAYYYRPGTNSNKWYIHHQGGVRENFL